MKKVIYKISNTINDKIYIGSSEKFNRRYNQHKHHLLKNTHHNTILQNHVNKYGFESLKFEIIENVLGCLIEREQYFIDKLKPYFNIRKIADSMKGTKRTNEQKKYMVEQRNLKSGYLKGWKHSEESKQKISKSNIGKKLSEETRLKIGITSKGRTHTKETKNKISISHKGKNVSEETKNKLKSKKLAEKNPMFNKVGELHHNFGKKWICKKRKITKKIIDVNTGNIFNSIKEASLILNINESTLNKYILGYNKNINNFKYYEN